MNTPHTPNTPHSQVVETARFRSGLKKRLDAAVAAVDAAEPREDCPHLEVVETNIDRAQGFILDTLHPPEERKREDEEQAAKTRKRTREKGLEYFQTKLDERVQHLVQMIALGAPHVIVRNNVEMVLLTIADLMDRCAPDVFDEINNGPLHTSGDARVSALVRAIHEYRRGEA